MEFSHTQSRYKYNPSFMIKRDGLALLHEQQSTKQPHIVFNTRNLTKSLTKNQETPSNINTPSKVATCLLSSHGFKGAIGGASSLNLDSFEHNLLPLTVCTKHWNASFLPLDYVRKLPEYTQTTHNYPVFKVIHTFEDCVLEFPDPPPIGGSEECGWMNKCYQCFAKLSSQEAIFMYRDYLFCCPGCRLKACAAHYWYKKVMMNKSDR